MRTVSDEVKEILGKSILTPEDIARIRAEIPDAFDGRSRCINPSCPCDVFPMRRCIRAFTPAPFTIKYSRYDARDEESYATFAEAKARWLSDEESGNAYPLEIVDGDGILIVGRDREK